MLTHGQSLPASLLRRWLMPGLSPRRRLRLREKKSSKVVGMCGQGKEAFCLSNCRRRSLSFVPGALNSNVDSISRGSVKKRNIVEHIFLLKAKPDISEDEEKNMLDYLYTSQYQTRGIIAISLGRIADSNVDGFTHAVYMRFHRKEDLAKFYGNSYYARVLKEHGSISVDYESRVEDDILPIFRRGEEFNHGVEFVLLISVSETALHTAVDDALTMLQSLIDEFDSLIIQATQGFNFNQVDGEYTHGAIIRFPSLEAFEIFRGCPEYKDMWRWKIQPITKKALAVHFAVDPVGTELM